MSGGNLYHEVMSYNHIQTELHHSCGSSYGCSTKGSINSLTFLLHLPEFAKPGAMPHFDNLCFYNMMF